MIKKSEIPEMPRELWAIRDAAIEHALTGAVLPPDLKQLHEWLEMEGWVALVAAWEKQGEPVALHFDRFSRSHLSDEEFHSREVLEKGEELNDARRVEYARNQMTSALESDDGYTASTVHGYVIQRDDGCSAVIGCTLESRGQGQPEAFWHGVFSTKEAFIDQLRKSGMLLWHEAEALDDATILAAWKVDKKVKQSKKGKVKS